MENPIIHYHENDLPSDLSFGSSIAIDTETMGLKIKRDKLCVVQLSSGDGVCHVVKLGKDYNAPNLKKLLGDPKVLKIFHFARFDLAAIKNYLGVECVPVYCTKIASKLCRTNTDSHGLAHLCRDLLGVELSKQQQTSDWGAEKLTPEQVNYAASDVLYLHQLKAKLDTLLTRESRKELADACFSFLMERAKLDLAGFEETDIFSH